MDAFTAVHFTVGLLFGILVFLGRRRPRSPWGLLALPLAACALTPLYACVTPWRNGSLPFPVVGFALYYCACVAVMVCVLRWTFPMRWLEALVTVVAGYALQHITIDVELIIVLCLTVNPDVPPRGMQGIWMLVGVGGYVPFMLAAYLLVGRRMVIDHTKIRNGRAWITMGMGILALVIVANLLVEREPVSIRRYCYPYDLLCTVLALAVLMLVSSNDVLAADLAVLRRSEQLQVEHYALAKETIDLINIKCHDFRKTVGDMVRAEHHRPTEEAVRRLEHDIRIYESIFHTGSEPLDVILTEKSLLCEAKGITLTCMADGSALSFLDDVEIYALFTNLLDNAIEATESLADERRRTIDLTVRAIGGLVLVESCNYYEGEPRMRDGLPLTTKGDERYHGFGMRSMERIVSAHDGVMDVNAAEGVFRLSITWPFVG